ncbi:hypothetical protein GCM10010172_28630 [Paractinoplanes ferrugineus]|uniref:Uncharacterized protein n=1 Tax=Paractinoplanes ferrugineus TaxID=113564 RepID=A0A919IUU3_9ACTN|nr:hypothetical protein Afe05nite_00670 [Actinoplanes ferrugineus]
MISSLDSPTENAGHYDGNRDRNHRLPDPRATMCRMSLVSPKSHAAEEEGRVGRQDSHNKPARQGTPEPLHAGRKR